MIFVLIVRSRSGHNNALRQIFVSYIARDHASLRRMSRARRFPFSSRHIRVPATLAQTPLAPSISPDLPATAKAEILIAHHRQRRRRRCSHRSPIASTCLSTLASRRRSSHAHRPRHGSQRAHLALRITALETPWRVAAAAARGALVSTDFAARQRTAATSRSTFSDGHGQALHNATTVGALAGIHAVVGAEVPADHEGLCGGAIARKGGGLVRDVGAVFAVVDADFAEVAEAGLVWLVER